MKTARLFAIEGQVQGVGFRFFVEGVATELGLNGYVCNRADGSVEVYALGEEAVLEQLREQLERGPRSSRVVRVVERPAPLRNYQTFSIEASR